ncbi:hypothetical protein DEO72_LG10g2250 [Vigna unguiculata]|uniref:Uncharacterized protein n=1 Tax=Vigna unguiculata TaxID=3917 RepID=A0A4D6NGE4_VIGUN|nr:hypothetical protein DEO72_LG10g2250 [Vigna unguiculata]
MQEPPPPKRCLTSLKKTDNEWPHTSALSNIDDGDKGNMPRFCNNRGSSGNICLGSAPTRGTSHSNPAEFSLITITFNLHSKDQTDARKQALGFARKQTESRLRRGRMEVACLEALVVNDHGGHQCRLRQLLPIEVSRRALKCENKPQDSTAMQEPPPPKRCLTSLKKTDNEWPHTSALSNIDDGDKGNMPRFCNNRGSSGNICLGSAPTRGTSHSNPAEFSLITITFNLHSKDQTDARKQALGFARKQTESRLRRGRMEVACLEALVVNDHGGHQCRLRQLLPIEVSRRALKKTDNEWPHTSALSNIDDGDKGNMPRFCNNRGSSGNICLGSAPTRGTAAHPRTNPLHSRFHFKLKVILHSNPAASHSNPAEFSLITITFNLHSKDQTDARKQALGFARKQTESRLRRGRMEVACLEALVVNDHGGHQCRLRQLLPIEVSRRALKVRVDVCVRTKWLGRRGGWRRLRRRLVSPAS